MKGNQHYTEKQLERILNEPTKDTGWGRNPVHRPSELERVRSENEALLARSEYYAERCDEIEQSQFRLANEVDALRAVVEDVEWVEWVPTSNEAQCPSCGAFASYDIESNRYEGEHHTDCALRAALKGGE